MRLQEDLFNHYKELVESGELTPEEVPGPKQMIEEWGCGEWVANQTRKMLKGVGFATKLNVALPLGPISDMVMAFDFLPKVQPRNADGCLIWGGATDGGGYGKFYINGRHAKVHRVAYEYRNGPIAPGLELDHVFDRGCRSKLCVNVQHLEAVTDEENMRRRRDWVKARGAQ